MSQDSRALYGRNIIYTDAEEINSTNVVDILKDCADKFTPIQNDIKYLKNYYRGKQPILDRRKDFNENINNKITINRAQEIVEFKQGYFMSAPIQFIDDDAENEVTPELKRFNDFMKVVSKNAIDMEIVEDFLVTGTAYKMIVAPETFDENLGQSPFEIYELDPETTFVVYSTAVGHKPMMGVTLVTTSDDKTIYTVYTGTEVFTIEDDKIVDHETHAIGGIPIIEYPANKYRLGAFEIVIPLLDAINLTESNRLDGVEQFIQALLVIEGMELVDLVDDGRGGQKEERITITQLKEEGGLNLPSGSKAYYLMQELNQGETQTLIDDMYDAVLTICGMPQRQHTASGGDTGAAILLKDGWSSSEARAKKTEACFERSERKFLALAINIANTIASVNLNPYQVDIRFPRRNYTNDSAKVSNLIAMLNCEKISPQLAFAHSDMFPDPNAAYVESMKYYEESEQKETEELANLNRNYVADTSGTTSTVL